MIDLLIFHTFMHYLWRVILKRLFKANTHGAVADLVEHHLGRELIRPSGTAAGVEEASGDHACLQLAPDIDP